MSDLEVIQDNSTLFDLKEFVFQKALVVSGGVMILILLGIFGTLVVQSWPAIVHHGFGFFYKENWDPVFGEFGGLSFLLGTLLTSFLACVIALPFSLAIAIFLGEYFRHGKIAFLLGSAVDVLASIPSVIYGFWGLFVVVPFVRQLQIGLGIVPYGVGIFTAALILAIMIVPYGASLAKEVIQLVPQDLKEAALSLGATPTEVMWKIILPYARSGIFAGQLLALGRALGETMAVTMVIGNANILPTSIFSPSTTMATVIANEFAEATGQLYLSSLIEIGLLLFIVTTVISMIGRLIINRLSLR